MQIWSIELSDDIQGTRVVLYEYLQRSQIGGLNKFSLTLFLHLLNPNLTRPTLGMLSSTLVSMRSTVSR
jgi:hypothetical protein